MTRKLWRQPPVWIRPTDSAAISFYTSGNTSGPKNNWLILQAILCYGGLENIVHVKVDDKSYKEQRCIIDVFKEGSVVSQMAIAANNAATNDRRTAYFTDLAYTTAAFYYDREDGNYNGVPNMEFFVFGLKIATIVKNGNVYSLSSGKTYSNNPARVLLDYLMRNDGGKGIKQEFFDLESFYKAQQICERVAWTNQRKQGIIYGMAEGITEEVGKGTLSLKLYECNLALDSGAVIRDNVEKILETMELAELIWTQGVYKLRLLYPTMYAANTTYKMFDIVEVNIGGLPYVYESLIDNNNRPLTDKTAWNSNYAAELTDDDLIIDGEINIIFPNAQERANTVKVRFINEAKNFVDDEVSWPTKNSDVHKAMLKEDGNIELVDDIFADGITDFYHASSKAQQKCRFTRMTAKYTFKLLSKWAKLEPCDLVILSSESLNLNRVLIRITEVKITEKGEIEVTGSEFSASILIRSEVPEPVYVVPEISDGKAPQATGLKWITLESDDVSHSKLSYDKTPTVEEYLIHTTLTPAECVDSTTAFDWVATTELTAANLDLNIFGHYVIAVQTDTFAAQSIKYDNADQKQRWPLLDVCAPPAVDTDGVITIQRQLFLRSDFGAGPPPIDIAFNYAKMSFDNTQGIWSEIIENDDADLYMTTCTFNSADNVYKWSPPLEISEPITWIKLTRQLLIVKDFDADDENNPAHPNYVGDVDGDDPYDLTYGYLQVFLEFNNMTSKSELEISIKNFNNCTAELQAKPYMYYGAKYSVISLNGDLGSFMIEARVGGITLQKYVTVCRFKDDALEGRPIPMTPTVTP